MTGWLALATCELGHTQHAAGRHDEEGKFHLTERSCSRCGTDLDLAYENTDEATHDDGRG